MAALQTEPVAVPLARPTPAPDKGSPNWLPIGVIALALGALWFIACRHLSQEWSANEQYNYGWFVPFFAAYLLWLRWEDRPEVGSLKSAVAKAVAISLIVGSAVILLPLRVFEIGSADWRPLGWVHVSASTIITLSVFYLVGGKGWLRHFSFPILFVFVAVPWIGPIEGPIVQGLMRLIAASAAETLAIFGIPAEVQGNLIRLPRGLVGVNEACSGVRSLQTSLMIGLLFGELKRLKLGSRFLLVGCAIAIALFANFLRATFLVWIASERDLSAVGQWHDIAGYAIVVLVFVGTMLLASRFKTGLANPKSEIRNPKSEVDSSSVTRHSSLRLITRHASLVAIGGGLLVWFVLVEAGAEFWYRMHERDLVLNAGWSVRWPEGEPGYREIKIDNEVRNILRYDIGHEAMWSAGRNSAFAPRIDYLLFLRWNPGTGTILRARAHRPDICLPASGWTQIGSDRIRPFEIAPGRPVPFHRFEFEKHNGPSLYATAYFTLHEDVTHENEADPTIGSYSNWDLADRWRVVRNGIRNRGQQVLELLMISAAPPDESSTDQAFAELLPKVINTK